MRIINIILLSLVSSSFLCASPSWYENDVSDEFPDYFVGKGFAEIEDKNYEKAESKAKKEALKNAASLIYCEVSGQTINQSKLVGSDKNLRQEDYFLSETQVKTDLEIMGYEILKTEHDKKNFYVLVGIPAKKMRNALRNKISNSIQNISETFVTAEEMRKSDPKTSLKKYEECIAETSTLHDDLNIYLFLNDWNNDLKYDLKKLPSSQQIEKKLIALAGSIPISSRDLAKKILKPFILDNAENYSFTFYPFIYENTGFIPHFGKNFADICKGIIIEKNNWTEYYAGQYGQADVTFKGKIMEIEKGAMISLTMKSKSGMINKNNQIFLNNATCNNIGWDKIRPENLRSALENKLALFDAIQTDNKLQVEFRSDKTVDGPITYYYGDEPKFFVRANKSCYLRLIYIFSDDTKTLLRNNYFIAPDQLNQWINLPFQGIICEPSGVEQLILQASTEKQPPVNFHRQELGNGTFINIIEGDIAEQIAATRGLKLKYPKKEITEKVYQWTVFESR